MSWQAAGSQAAGSAIAPPRPRLSLSHDREHVTFPEQHAAAGRPVTADLAGHQPSINGPYSDAAQLSDLPFGQQLLVIGVFRWHDLVLSRHAPFHRVAWGFRLAAPRLVHRQQHTLGLIGWQLGDLGVLQGVSRSGVGEEREDP
jgi:hypothetical protein